MKLLEENVALNRSSQSTFTKAVKNIKHLIKKGSVTVKNDTTTTNEAVKPDAIRKKKVPKPSDRGVVYLTHVPHGFYEDAMVSYFTQFGQVTGIKLIRSRKNGNSRGFAFIEFLHTEVAKVAAETMNNYLMFDKLIKAEYVPPEKQKRMVFNRGLNTNKITAETCQRAKNRKHFILKKNNTLTPAKEAKALEQRKKNLATLKKKLEKDGITFNFEPVEESQAVVFSPDASREGDYGEDGAPVITLDMSDPEIDFTAPPGTVIRPLKRGEVKHKRGEVKHKRVEVKDKQGEVKHKRGRRSKSPGKLSKIPRAKNIEKKITLDQEKEPKQGFGLNSSDKKVEKKLKNKANVKPSKIRKPNFGFTVTPREDKIEGGNKLDTSSANKEKGISYSGKGKGRRSSVK